VETEKHFRKIMGHHQLWMLKSLLDEPCANQDLASNRKVG
jgi:hypothetical protein